MTALRGTGDTWVMMRQPLNCEPVETGHVGSYARDAADLEKQLQDVDPYATYFYTWRSKITAKQAGRRLQAGQ